MNDSTLRVCCAVIVDRNLTLVARRSMSGELPGRWEFPGGKLTVGETAEQAVVREIREELGCEIRILRPLPSNFHDYGPYQVNLMPFLAAVAAGSPEPLEHAELMWADRSALLSLDWAEADVPIVGHVLRLKMSVDEGGAQEESE